MTKKGQKLFDAIDMNNYAEVETLLESGAPVGERDEDGNTPLIRALQAGHSDIAKLLLDYESDIHARNNTGSTPLMYAAWRGNAELAGLLCTLGAQLNEANNHGITPLLGAVIGNEEEMVTHLLLWGADALATSKDGRTACDYAEVNTNLSRRGGDTLIAMPDYPAREKAARIMDMLKARGAEQGAALSDMQQATRQAAIYQEQLRRAAPKFRL